MTTLYDTPSLRRAVFARLDADPEARTDRPAARRAIARALAAEGVVTSPAVWARLVRTLLDAYLNPALGAWATATTTDPSITVTY